MWLRIASMETTPCSTSAAQGCRLLLSQGTRFSEKPWLISVVLIILIFVRVSFAARVPPGSSRLIETESLLSREEKTALERVESAIAPNLTIGWRQDFFKNKIMLMRYLRANNMNAEATINNVFQFMTFGKQINLDTILEEDWSDMSGDFPYHTDVIDREGRPVCYWSMTEGWNIRRGIIHGKRERMNRYMNKLAFEMALKLSEAHKRMPNVTQVVFLINMEGFNPLEHSCPLCIQTYIYHLNIAEQFLPEFVQELILINVGPSWNLLYQLIKPFIPQEKRETLKIFDTNRDKWKSYLDSRIDPEQLPWEFGGNNNKTSSLTNTAVN